jgi:DNA-binding NarL/FixJ family response regulator
MKKMSIPPTPPKRKRSRILLADDDLLMLAKVRNLLQADFEVIDAVSDGRALIEAAFKWKPDIIVSDISMPKLNGIAAAREIRDSLPNIKVVFLTMHGERWYRAEALRVGAAAYILKTSAREELNQAVHDATEDPAQARMER